MGQALLLPDLSKGASFIAAAAVGDHHPRIVSGDYLLHFLVPVPGPHLIDRGLVGVEGHQVGVLSTHLPARVVSVDRWRVPYRMPQLLVGGTHGTLGPAQGVLGDRPLGQLHPSQEGEHQGHLAHWNPYLVVQDMGGGHGPRPYSVGSSPVLVWG